MTIRSRAGVSLAVFELRWLDGRGRLFVIATVDVSEQLDMSLGNGIYRCFRGINGHSLKTRRFKITRAEALTKDRSKSTLGTIYKHFHFN